MKRWLTLRSRSRQVPSHNSHSRRTALRLEQLEDRLVPAQYAFSSAGDSLQIHLETAESVQVSESGGDVTFTLNTGTFTQTGVNVATGDGTSSITVARADLATTLAINNQPASAGTNNVTFSGAGSVSTALFSVNLSAGDPAAVGTISFMDGFDVSATASITLTTPRNIAVLAGTELAVSGSGDIALSANQQATPTSGSFVGIDLQGATLTTSGTGGISLYGRSGDSGATKFGVSLIAGAVVQSTATGATAGTIDITGVGGENGGNNTGVRIAFAGTRVTSVDGAIHITGQGGNGTSSGNIGVGLAAGASITSTGVGANAATITIDGTGGTGTSTNRGVSMNSAGTLITSVDGDIQITGQGGTGSSFDNTGVSVLSIITSTGTTSDAARIVIEGTGGSGTSNNVGVAVSSSDGLITSEVGAIQITGQGGMGADGENRGVATDGAAVISSTGTEMNAATITIDGTGGTGTGNNHGVSLTSGTPLNTVTGSVAIRGVAGAGTSTGVEVSGSGQVFVTGATQVMLTADSIDLTATNAIAAPSSVVSIVTATAGAAIDLSGADTTGVLGLTDTELDAITAETIQIGTTDTGPITVSGTIDHSGGTNFIVSSGQDITFLDGVTAHIGIDGAAPGSGHDQFIAGGGVDLAHTQSGAELQLVIDNDLLPDLGQEFTLFDNRSANPTRGIFQTLVEGQVFEGDNGLFFRITYRGGDGNDVVIRRVLAEQLTDFALPGFMDPDTAYPIAITTGPDGALWFVNSRDVGTLHINAIGRIDTAGNLTQYPIPTPMSGANSIVTGPDGALWFTEGVANKIGRITTAGVFTEFNGPTAGANPGNITLGHDGALWFTERSKNKIGRITTDGVFTEFVIPTPTSSPADLTIAPDGAIWFTQSNSNKIGRLTINGDFTEFDVPTPSAGLGSITTGPDGNIWFCETSFDATAIARITPDGTVTEFPVPNKVIDLNPNGVNFLSAPSNLFTGPDGALWFLRGATKKIGTHLYGAEFGRLTTSGEFSFHIPTDLSGSGIFSLTTGPDGNLWAAQPIKGLIFNPHILRLHRPSDLASVTTVASAGPTQVLGSGEKLSASATLAGGSNATGTVTFTLLDPSHQVVHTEQVAVQGAGSYSTSAGYLPTVTGRYQWLAGYSGDAANNPSASVEGAASQTVNYPPNYHWNDTDNTLAIHLGTNQSVTVSQLADMVSFTLTTGGFAGDGGDTAAGDGTNTITFAAADLVTAVMIDNSLAESGTTNVTFSGDSQLSSATIAVSLTAADVVGTISFTDGFDLSATTAIDLTTTRDITLASGSALSTADGTIQLSADLMRVEGIIPAGSGTVLLKPTTPGTAVDLGGDDAQGVLGLTNAELNRISAGTIHIGDSTSGPVTVSAPLAFNSPATVANTLPGDSGLLDGRAVSAYVERDAADNLLGIGLKFAGDLVRNPPTSQGHAHLDLPLVAGHPFMQLEIGFEPTGHPPPGIYSFAHFDFHFYTIDEATREAIPGGPPQADPGAQFRPAGFRPPAGVVPEMGAHAYDGTGPEFNGGRFTKTFMYGFYNAALVFLEAAATPAYLADLAELATSSAEFEIRQPQEYALAGLPTLMPTRWQVRYDADLDEYTLSIRQFESVPPPPPHPTNFVLETPGIVSVNADFDTDSGSLTIQAALVHTADGVTVTTGSGTLSVSQGSVALGGSPGQLTVAGKTAFSSNSPFQVDIDSSSPGDGYDQLVATDLVSLGDAPLEVSLGFMPWEGQSFTLIDNHSGNAITETFANLPEGKLFLVDDLVFRITYQGGTGDDVVLTRLATPPATLVVDNTSDVSDGDYSTGQFSLREAVELANLLPDANTITFAPAVFPSGVLTTITVQDDLELMMPGSDSKITIQGPGAERLALSGARLTGVVTVDAGVSVELADLTITQGRREDGGGVLNQGGTVVLRRVVISDCEAEAGGAIASFSNQGSLTLEGCTISNNRADTHGGGIFNSDGTLIVTNSAIINNHGANEGGGIEALTDPVLTNVTISGNTTNGRGGGIFLGSGIPLTLTNVTITDNHADNDDSGGETGGGVYSQNGLVQLRNSIVSGNYRGSGQENGDDLDGLGTIDAFFSLLGVSGVAINGSNNLDGDPRLGPLADNGGPTLTHALLSGSPAIDAGDLSTVGLADFDQRGTGFDRVKGSRVDLGAFESDVTFNGGFEGPDGDDLGDDFTLTSGRFVLSNGTAVARGNRPAQATVDVSLADVAVDLDVTLAGKGSRAGAIARYTPKHGNRAESYYWGRLRQTSDEVLAELRLVKNGVARTLVSVPVQLGNNRGQLRFEVFGTALKLFVDGNLVAFTNDAALREPGLVGIRARTGAALDNFAVSPLTAVQVSLPFQDDFTQGTTGNTQLSRSWTPQLGNFRLEQQGSNGRARGDAATSVATLNSLVETNLVVQAVVTFNGSGNDVGFVTNYTRGSKGDSYYWGYLAQDANNRTTANIFKVVNGKVKALANGTVQLPDTFNGTIPHALALSVSGEGILTLSVDDVGVVTVTEASPLTGGSVGIRSSQGGTVAHFQVFQAL